MKNKITASLAALTLGALALSGCAPSDSSENIKIAVFNGWDEGIAVSELWKAVLESKGKSVSLEYSDAAAVFLGLSDGDYDLTLDVWLPGTHASYLESYGSKITDLGAWNSEAKLTIAVNSSAPINSLTELAANAELFENKLIGIEPGAGLTEAVQDKVIPQYGLESIEFITSSTPAMLTELSTALSNGENVAVTLWQPHWAYGVNDIKNLEDPLGALGGAEGIHTFSRLGFEDTEAEVAAWLKAFKMDTEKLHDLEAALFANGYKDNYDAEISAWIAANQEWVDSLTK